MSTPTAAPVIAVDNRRVGVDHYENFPVASWLCPARLRPAVTAIYHFARTADDIADEGDAAPEQRRALLDRYALSLKAAASGHPDDQWPQVFVPLTRQMREHDLPVQPLADLLSAFRQDTANPHYPDRAALLDYCARSANPIGRLLLHLARVDNRAAQAESDAICTALQLANFWQDLSVDLPRGRCYVPEADARRYGLGLPVRCEDSAASRALIRDLVGWARDLMLEGAPLVHRMPGRFGWELRLVVQGGLRILDKIEQRQFDAMAHRVVIGRGDAARLAWRALRMRPDDRAPNPAGKSPTTQP
jgi:hydroxysqualene synthase